MRTKIAKAVTQILVKEWNKRDIVVKDIANKTDLSRDALNKIKRGDRNVSLDSAFAIAKALGVSLGDIINKLNE